MFTRVSSRVGLSHDPIYGSRALAQDYCWGSPASLYTFRETNTLLDLARDYPSMYLGLPRIHPVFLPNVTIGGPKDLGKRSTTELPRRIIEIVF